jgi:hypothetical protein
VIYVTIGESKKVRAQTRRKQGRGENKTKTGTRRKEDENRDAVRMWWRKCQRSNLPVLLGLLVPVDVAPVDQVLRPSDLGLSCTGFSAKLHKLDNVPLHGRARVRRVRARAFDAIKLTSRLL